MGVGPVQGLRYLDTGAGDAGYPPAFLDFRGDSRLLV